MTDFNKISTKMIDMRSVIKLVHQLSLEIYVNVTVHEKTNIEDSVWPILSKFYQNDSANFSLDNRPNSTPYLDASYKPENYLQLTALVLV